MSNSTNGIEGTLKLQQRVRDILIEQTWTLPSIECDASSNSRHIWTDDLDETADRIVKEIAGFFNSEYIEELEARVKELKEERCSIWHLHSGQYQKFDSFLPLDNMPVESLIRP
jgi:hypothetical protein